MNWYEHHIKDYDAATSHLSWEEDLAYTRLLRWYYRKESPIPNDLDAVCRLVRAATDLQRAAVFQVLQEFFELQDDGCWHKDTCDDAIRAYQAGLPEREAKKANEETRLERHRAERRELFSKLNAAGQHMRWNAPIDEVRAAVAALETPTETAPKPGKTGKPATPATPAREPPQREEQPATQTATGTATPATATHPPTTTHQPPPTIVLRNDLLGPLAPVPPPKPPDDFTGLNAEAFNGKTLTRISDAFELPADWGFDAEKLGFGPRQVATEAERFRQYWAKGAGKDKRRTVKGWRQSWSNWLAKAAERMQR